MLLYFLWVTNADNLTTSFIVHVSFSISMLLCFLANTNADNFGPHRLLFIYCIMAVCSFIFLQVQRLTAWTHNLFYYYYYLVSICWAQLHYFCGMKKHSLEIVFVIIILSFCGRLIQVHACVQPLLILSSLFFSPLSSNYAFCDILTKHRNSRIYFWCYVFMAYAFWFSRAIISVIILQWNECY